MQSYSQVQRAETRRINRGIAKLIDKTQELLAGPNKDGKGWTKGTFARNKGRQEVSELDQTATSFCVLGGLNRARDELDMDSDTFSAARSRLFNVLVSRNTHIDIPHVNDSKRTTFPQVMMALDLVRVGAGKF